RARTTALSFPVPGPLAQLVEQGTLNPKVEGSNPSRPIRGALGGLGYGVSVPVDAEPGRRGWDGVAVDDLEIRAADRAELRDVLEVERVRHGAGEAGGELN